MIEQDALEYLVGLGVDNADRKFVAVDVPGTNIKGFIGGNPASLEEYRDVPTRKKGDFATTSVDDFIYYVNRHKGAGTELWGFETQGRIRAVLDDHSEDQPGWRGHCITLNLGLDVDFQNWRDNNNRLMSQDEFSTFIKNQSHCITDPDAAQVIDIVNKFEATQVKTFKRPVFDEQSGSVKIAYEDESNATGNLKLPKVLGVYAPVFKGANPLTLAAETRFRFREGTVHFGYSITRIDKYQTEAFEAVVKQITSATELTVIHG